MASQKDMINDLKRKKILVTERIEQALHRVRRETYGPTDKPLPCVDAPQSIGYYATISAMHMHVICLELLRDHLHDAARGLDVGSGSGYLTAVMGLLVAPEGLVVGVEHIPELVSAGRRHIEKDQPQLMEQGIVQIVEGDGRLGYPTGAPYDFIHVGAAAESIPEPLLDQLAPGGRLIIPVQQSLRQVDKKPDGTLEEIHIAWVTYIPLCDKDQQLRGD